jgi:methylmalonyl-CoA mutase N-terminal domain/subunit
VESGDAHVVGVNVHRDEEAQAAPPIFRVDPAAEERQRKALAERKAARDAAAVRGKLDALREAARGDGPVMEPLVDVLRAEGSLGEVCHALREVWGTHRAGATGGAG